MSMLLFFKPIYDPDPIIRPPVDYYLEKKPKKRRAKLLRRVAERPEVAERTENTTFARLMAYLEEQAQRLKAAHEARLKRRRDEEILIRAFLDDFV